MKATVSEKGQVTIPKALRDRLGIKAGQALDFEERNGQLIARKAALRDPVDAAYGILKLAHGTDAFVETIRGKVDEG